MVATWRTPTPATWFIACSALRTEPISFLIRKDYGNKISLPPTIALAKAVQEFKGNTSRWLNEMSRFAWQEGYSAFSVSQSQRKTVVDYIDRQAEHHAKWSFEQEFLTLLKKSGIPYDPRFVLG